MLRDENFKIKYQASENSVPVNTELKNKLMAMAKACESGEIPEEVSGADIKITELAKNKEKRNIRHIIIKTAALAACLAVCVCSIPKVADIYFSRTGDKEPEPGIISTQEPIAGVVETKEEDKQENTEQGGIGNEKEGTNDNLTGGERVNNIKADSSERKGAETNNTGSVTAAVTGQRENASNTAVSTPQSGNTVTGTAEQDTVQLMIGQSGDEQVNVSDVSAAVRSVDIIKSYEEDDEILTSRDEFNKRLTLLDKQKSKLEAWDSELKPYVGRSAVLDRSYEDFSGDKAVYNKAADAYTAKYTAADTEEELQNGITEYDAELGDDSGLFNECRESYRKSVNYIEMSGMNEDISQTTAAPETEAETIPAASEPAETEGTVNEESDIEN
ncbi:MAG: hypothetical protein ACI38A_05020 [Candidatus Ornithomonoglobus sp.]